MVAWAIAGVLVAAGLALCAFVPGAQPLGARLILSGAIGLAFAAASPAVVQFVGGLGSVVNGCDAVSVGWRSIRRTKKTSYYSLSHMILYSFADVTFHPSCNKVLIKRIPGKPIQR